MTPMCPTAPPDAVELLNGWRRVVCIGHVNPDPDCLGALGAVARALAQQGRDVRVVLPPGSLSARTGFLMDMAGITLADDAALDAADGFFVADTARRSRMNLPAGINAEAVCRRPVLNVDHHITNSRFGQVNWVVDDAASSCELICALLCQMHLEVDAVTASLLYAGILTDTAGFTLASTGVWSLQAAAFALERGADVAMLGERLMRALSASDFRLLSILQHNTRTAADGRIAYSVANYEEIHEAGCQPADIDDQVKVPRSLAGVKLAILFTEAEPGLTRINFRGEQGANVLPLAEQFGGGGHAQAAGARLACTAEEAVKRVVPAAIAMLNGHL